MASKRIALTLDEKVKIIEAVETGNKKKGDVAKEFRIPQSSLSTILKDKTKIVGKFRSGKSSAKCKRLRPPKYEDVEDALFMWFKEVRAKNISLSGNILIEKARNFAFLLGHDDFKVSDGWLARFKQRHNIVSKKLCGESASASDETAAEWLDTNMSLISKYDPNNVFNVDETGLFFRSMPEQTLTVKDDDCHGGKKSKDRVSILMCCNMLGSEKLKLHVIGKSKNPRCLKGVRSLPVEYYSNKKAWMTRPLFEDWLLKLDNQMKKCNRKILLLLDNASVHATAARLDSVQLLFFPPNMTSKVQPLDMGIIRSTKVNYRRRLVKRIILNIEANKETKIDIRMAIDMIYGAWQDVTDAVIQNCFAKAGIFNRVTEVTLEHPEQLGDVEGLWSCLDLPRDVTFDAFVDIDKDLVANEVLTDADIVQQVHVESDAVESDGNEAEPEVPVEGVTADEAIDCLQKVRHFLQEKDNVPTNIHNYIDKIEVEIMNASLKKKVQTKITDFMRETQ